MILDYFFGFLSNDIAVDLGTANTLVYTKDRGIIANEPSVVAIQDGGKGTKNILAVGTEAKKMVGRTPSSIRSIRPLKDGVIADFDAAHKLLEHFIKMSTKRKTFVHPRVVISVPLSITEVEKRAVRESAEAAGAREVFLIEETLCAALGANMPVMEPSGSMVIDIGGGTAGIAVISLSDIVVSESVKVAGDKFDEAILQYVKRNFSMLIGERTAEDIKKRLGDMLDSESDTAKEVEIRGRNLRTGIPMTATISSNEIQEALEEPISVILEAIRNVLEKTPPELSADLVDSGITLAGGGALLGGLAQKIHEGTQLPVKVAKDPLTCAVIGSGKALEEIEILRRVQHS